MADLISMLAAASGIGAEEADPNFNQTVLLLHGDGTNGAQNNTFLDSSTNNFTITRNGNTTQGTFSPFSLAAGEWSNYFDGTDDYLNLGGQSELAFGAGDFCIEFFVYFSGGLGADIVLYDSRPNNTNGAYPTIYVNSSNKVVYVTSSADRITSTTSMAYGSWFHICVSRSGTDTKLFINGTQEGSTYSDSTTYLNGASRPTIGTNGFNVTAAELPGYISNLRVVKGSTVRTANFTVPTSPLTAITNTQLLTCQSNRFVDNSTNAFAITRNGDVKVTPFSPFAPTAAYSAGTNGGSGYFDGSGDYLSIASQSALALGTGDFQISYWIYPTVFSANEPHIMWVTAGDYPALFSNASGNIVLDRYASGTLATTTNAMTLNAWNYIVCSRVGTTLKIWINGSEGASITNSTNFGQSAIRIGNNGFTADIDGYISDMRVVKGSGVTSVTVPTSPATAITNTQLLLNFTNAGIIDNTGKNNLETVGNAQIDTAVKKYGTGSLEFDGTGDYLLQTTNMENYVFGTGDFTIEFWLYLNVTNVEQGILGFRPNQTNGNYPTIYFLSGTLRYNVNGTDRASGSVSASIWYHVAVARSGTATKLFINGTQAGSTYTDTTNYLAARLVVGGNDYDLTIIPLNGYIDDLRITKGVARYTANFTPPTAAFPNE